jgi:hypothetical protein
MMITSSSSILYNKGIYFHGPGDMRSNLTYKLLVGPSHAELKLFRLLSIVRFITFVISKLVSTPSLRFIRGRGL